jgi:hypothetical protein
MAATQTEDTAADSTDSDDERPEYPWVSLSPEVSLGFDSIERLIYTGDPSDTQNGNDYGVVLRGAEVLDGTIYVNRHADDGVLARNSDTATAQEQSTDYVVANPDTDDRTSEDMLDGTVIGVSDGARDFDSSPTDETSFDTLTDTDAIIVWFGGLSGQFIARDLDFNGRPSAKYTDDGYLVKGLYQYPQGWWDASPSAKGEMVQNGLAPRVARFPVLRDDLADGDVPGVIETSRDGRSHRVSVFADIDVDDGDGDGDDVVMDSVGEYPQVRMTYNEDTAASVLAERGITMSMAHGDEWATEPDTVAGTVPTSDADDFDISVGDDGDAEPAGLTANEQLFADSIATALDDEGVAVTDLSDPEGFVAEQAAKPTNAPNLGVDPDPAEAAEALDTAAIVEYIAEEQDTE